MRGQGKGQQEWLLRDGWMASQLGTAATDVPFGTANDPATAFATAIAML